MAQTTNRNIYYPDDYTEAADIPADMKEMAESVDAAIEEAVQETTYDDTELRGRMLNAENDIDTLEGQVSTLQGSMSAAETDIDNLEVDLNSAKSEISNLQNDVEDLRKNSLQVSGTGTNFKLSNTAKARFIELFMNLNTYQYMSTGANLMKFTPRTTSGGGTNYVCTDKGEAILTGKATSNAGLYYTSEDAAIILNSGTYKLKVIGTGFENLRFNRTDTLDDIVLDVTKR